MRKLKNIFFVLIFSVIVLNSSNSAEKSPPFLETKWTFKGLFGKFDRASLQRGYQVYTEVCASCHSMKYLTYRNLAEKGCLLYTSPSPRDRTRSRMPSSA